MKNFISIVAIVAGLIGLLGIIEAIATGSLSQAIICLGLVLLTFEFNKYAKHAEDETL